MYTHLTSVFFYFRSIATMPAMNWDWLTSLTEIGPLPMPKITTPLTTLKPPSTRCTRVTRRMGSPRRPKLMAAVSRRNLDTTSPPPEVSSSRSSRRPSMTPTRVFSPGSLLPLPVTATGLMMAICREFLSSVSC